MNPSVLERVCRVTVMRKLCEDVLYFNEPRICILRQDVACYQSILSVILVYACCPPVLIHNPNESITLFFGRTANNSNIWQSDISSEAMELEALLRGRIEIIFGVHFRQ